MGTSASAPVHKGFQVHGIVWPPPTGCTHKERDVTLTTDAIEEDCPSTENLRDTILESWIAHKEYPFENVVLSGGGSKGYAFVGALKALEDCGILGRLKRVGGSSVGAVCAGLLAIGFTPQDIADVFAVDVKWLFQDQKFVPVYCIPNIWKKFGLHPGNRFYKIYGRHLANKTGNPDVTFRQLYEKLGVELCIVVTNLNRMCSEYCHPKTTPDMPVRLAVRMSMSFPVVYQPVQGDINGITSWYTDGGMLDQYPVHCFDGATLELNHNEGHTEQIGGQRFNRKTLGLYVVSETHIDYQIWKKLFGIEIPYKPSYVPYTKLARERLKDRFPDKESNKCSMGSKTKKVLSVGESMESLHMWPNSKHEVDIKNFGQFIAITLEALIVNQRKHKVKPNDVLRTIPVNCGYIGTNDYDLETGDREFMIRQGYHCTRSFLIDHISNLHRTNLYLSRDRNTHMHPHRRSIGASGHHWNWENRVASIETEV